MNGNKRALIIGSATYGLEGPEYDLVLMRKLMEERGFTSHILTEETASCEGIREGFKGLIKDSKEGDAALVYYSGHGGLVHNSDYKQQGNQPPYFQFLVPTDMHESTQDNFRGLLDLELSNLLAQLTAKTQNTTVILDCCHAARLMRDPKFRTRALDRPWELGLPEQARRLHQSEEYQRRYAGGNPDSIRLSAAGVLESACEYEGEDDKIVGMLTESLCMVLADRSTQPVSWMTVCKWVRERVLAMNSFQRVGLEGRGRRLLFQTEETDQVGVLSFFYDKDQASLRGGRLQGVIAGNVYGLMPRDAEAYTPDRQLGEVTVRKVMAGLSTVEVTGGQSPPAKLQAFLLKEAAPAWPVWIEGTAPENLLEAISRSDPLRLAGPEEEKNALATVRVEDGRFRVLDEDELVIGDLIGGFVACLC